VAGRTIGVFSADDGQIGSATGSGSFHFDFYNCGPNGVSVNVDDAVETSSGTFTICGGGVEVPQRALLHFRSLSKARFNP